MLTNDAVHPIETSTHTLTGFYKKDQYKRWELRLHGVKVYEGWIAQEVFCV